MCVCVWTWVDGFNQGLWRMSVFNIDVCAVVPAPLVCPATAWAARFGSAPGAHADAHARPGLAMASGRASIELELHASASEPDRVPRLEMHAPAT